MESKPQDPGKPGEVADRRDGRLGWLAARAALIVVAFGVLSAPIGRVGDPQSPAYEALEDETEKGPIDFAILGNSRPHVGIWPKLVTEGLQAEGLPRLRGYNFAVDGTDSMHHASFGSHGLVAQAKPPRVIVWAVDPLSFDASRKSNRLEQLVRRDVIDLARAHAPLEVVLDVATMQAFPPYKHRPLVLAKVEDKTEGIGGRLTKLQKIVGLTAVEHPKPRRYEHESDGFEPFVVLDDWEFRFYQRHAVHYAGEYQQLVLSDWHEAFARTFLARAKEKGVLVVMLEMPESPYYRDHFASTPKHRAWRERMKKLAESEGAVFWNDAEHYGSDHDFGDPGHLPRATAEDYSRFLGGKLARDPRVREALGALRDQAKIEERPQNPVQGR